MLKIHPLKSMNNKTPVIVFNLIKRLMAIPMIIVIIIIYIISVFVKNWRNMEKVTIVLMTVSMVALVVVVMASITRKYLLVINVKKYFLNIVHYPGTNMNILVS